MNTKPINVETFPDGSTIETDSDGNRTVFGQQAHTEYFKRLREEQSRPAMTAAEHNAFPKGRW